MGLLHKAVSKSIPELDYAGRVTRDRILQLTQKNISPYMVLSLLKGYGSFQKGAYLLLKKDHYISYASIGLGIEQISLSPEQLYPPETRGRTGNLGISKRRYYQIAPFFMQSVDSGALFWAFPLDDLEPCRVMLLLVAGSAFNPRMMVRLLADIRGVLIFPSGDL